MKKDDFRVATGLTTNNIANMEKNKEISMETLERICDALQCEITDVIELTNNTEVITKKQGAMNYARTPNCRMERNLER